MKRAEQLALNWIIKNNYTIQCLLQEDNLRDVIVEAFKAGVTETKNTKEFDEEISERIDDGILERLREESLVSFSSIKVENL